MDVFGFEAPAAGRRFPNMPGPRTETTPLGYRAARAWVPECSGPNASDPVAPPVPVRPDPEWRHGSVCRSTEGSGGEDVGYHWGDDSLF